LLAPRLQVTGLLRDALDQPAAWTVPAAFVVMVLVSRATPGRQPGNVLQLLTRLHMPERPVRGVP
jgi:hypothetical protein